MDKDTLIIEVQGIKNLLTCHLIKKKLIKCTNKEQGIAILSQWEHYIIHFA
jgi:hypothetical protein